MKTWLIVLMAVLTACANMQPTLDTTNVDRTLTPNEAVTRIEIVRYQDILWGGVIIKSRNLKDATEIEVLGYPLDDDGVPQRRQSQQQRFMIIQSGYLETADYTAGRWLSVVGKIKETRQGKVGEAAYLFPVVDARQLHLWPTESETQRPDTRFHFGLGVIFH